ncbi:MAG: hypothetical protein RMX96_30830 [Nostoc sp. ChiSLP02]|nr:hypothetical protein [Nostoc sp. DedSLP01]MDZ8189221.1 hypothetical protein [Nostoc sp. ChiSLP02]
MSRLFPIKLSIPIAIALKICNKKISSVNQIIDIKKQPIAKGVLTYKC